MRLRVRTLMVIVAISAIVVAIAIDLPHRVERDRLAFYRKRALEQASFCDQQREFCLANEGNRAYDISRVNLLGGLLRVGPDHPRIRFETWAAEAEFHRDQADLKRYEVERMTERMGIQEKSMLFP